ncbi:MAG TPA: hypothetical protein VGP72_31435 [Planctomycetota bacterium]|jgi:hypothetical protein
MKVDNVEPVKAPYLKIGLSDAAGNWITNSATNTYAPVAPKKTGPGG